jgi:hypothetical protein
MKIECPNEIDLPSVTALRETQPDGAALCDGAAVVMCLNVLPTLLRSSAVPVLEKKNLPQRGLGHSRSRSAVAAGRRVRACTAR